MLRTLTTTATIAALAAGAVIAGVPSGTAIGQLTSAAGIGPQFDSPQRNPYFPLQPGMVMRLRGNDEGERIREKVRITRRTKMIQGVRTRVVLDVVRSSDGSLVEKTFDWYAADNDGNIWYFGERTATYDEHGNIESREGSWKAGRDDARRGIIMPADPHPTDAYRQEMYRGHAEDQAWIVERLRVKVPAGTFRHSVRSFEWTRLEPHVVSAKLYGRGVGIIRERNVVGGREHLWLVSVHRP